MPGELVNVQDLIGEHSWGTTISYSEDGATYTEFAGVKSISRSGEKVTMSSANYLTMPLGKMRFRPGLWDGGEVTVVAHSQTSIRALLYSWMTMSACYEPLHFAIAYPCTGEEETFRGWISEVGEEIPDDDMIVITFKIKVTDDWEIA